MSDDVMKDEAIEELRRRIVRASLHTAIARTAAEIEANVKNYDAGKIANSIHVYENGRRYIGSKICAFFHLTLLRNEKLFSGDLDSVISILGVENLSAAELERRFESLKALEDVAEMTDEVKSEMLDEENELLEAIEFGKILASIITIWKYNSPILQLLSDKQRVPLQGGLVGAFLGRWLGGLLFTALSIPIIVKIFSYFGVDKAPEWLIPIFIDKFLSVLGLSWSGIAEASWVSIGIYALVALGFVLVTFFGLLVLIIQKNVFKKLNEAELVSNYIGRTGHGEEHLSMLKKLYGLLNVQITDREVGDIGQKYLESPAWNEFKYVRFLKKAFGKKYSTVLQKMLRTIHDDYERIGFNSVIQFPPPSN